MLCKAKLPVIGKPLVHMMMPPLIRDRRRKQNDVAVGGQGSDERWNPYRFQIRLLEAYRQRLKQYGQKSQLPGTDDRRT